MENRPIRVLLCSPRGNTGGITRWTNHVMNYYNSIQSDEIQLNWCYASKSKKDILTGTNFIIRIYFGIVNYFPFIKRLRKEVKYNKYDVVHFCSSASISLLRDIVTLKICHKRDVKTIIHFRFGRIPQVYQTQNWERRLLDRIIRLADKVIVIDKCSYTTLINCGYDNVLLLPNPLTPQINNIVDKVGVVERRERTILFAGHVLPSKGIFELIEACKDIPNIELKILGICTDEMRVKILELAGPYAEKWLEIKGDQPFDIVIEEMLYTELFVLPTYTEGFPNVILESMACGCSIITTPVGAIPEMLAIDTESPCGICVEARKVEQLKLAIESLLSNSQFAAELGRRAKERVNKEYSMNAIWKQMCAIWYNTVI